MLTDSISPRTWTKSIMTILMKTTNFAITKYSRTDGVPHNNITSNQLWIILFLFHNYAIAMRSCFLKSLLKQFLNFLIGRTHWKKGRAVVSFTHRFTLPLIVPFYALWSVSPVVSPSPSLSLPLSLSFSSELFAHMFILIPNIWYLDDKKH